MILKNVDFLSKPITLYYQGYPSHASMISGFLTILALVLVIIFSLKEIKALFKRESETPNSASFTYFIEDAGTLSFNPSSLFHYISFESLKDKGNEDFNFSYFNAFGIEAPVTQYASDINIKNYEHWLYGFCNNDSDIKDLRDIIKADYFTKSACIRKYYDSKNKIYYDTNHPKFRWPSLSHGTFHPQNNIYSVIIKECNQTILDSLFNGELMCKDISNYDMTARIAHFNFIDQYIDILKYKDPITRYSFRIENLLDLENYSVNHLNFNPSLLKSQIGYIFNKEKNEYSYYYSRDDVFSYQRTCDIFMAYSFYLNNRINYYERTYLTIQDILSKIGGTLNFITFIMTLINNFINSYFVLKDFNCLLNLFTITKDDIKKANRKNILNKKLKQVENIKKNSCAITRAKSTENTIKEELKEEDKDTITEQSLNTEKSENTAAQKVISTTENINENDSKTENNNPATNNNNVFSFSDYLLYTITCGKNGKKKEDLEIYENFMKKILSVEHLVQNYLKLNNLLILEKRRSKARDSKYKP